MDTSVQKEGVPGVSECLEYTSVLTQIIKEAKQNRGDLAIIWLNNESHGGYIKQNKTQNLIKSTEEV